MTRSLCLFVLFAFILSGCAARETKPVTPLVAQQMDDDMDDDEDAEWTSGDPSLQAMFRKIADTAVGTPYVRGGTNMGGFDCSGFVQWTYRNMGVTLPRTAREQSRVGQMVSYSDLRIGDIVTFRHPRRGYHTGIYMGNDQFVHSPTRRQRVRYSSLSDPYFRDTFIGARRISVGKDMDIEATTRRLALAEAEKRRRPDSVESAVTSQKKGQKKGRNVEQKKDGKPSGVKAVASRQDTGKQSSAKQSSGKQSSAKRNAGKTAASKKENAGKTVAAKGSASGKAAQKAPAAASTGKNVKAAKSAQAGKAAPSSSSAKRGGKAPEKTAAKSGSAKNAPKKG